MRCKINIILAFLFCIYSTNAQKNKKTFSILFVGNSLTYSNNLPLLVKKEAKKKQLKLTTTMLAKPNYAIADHLKEGSVQKELQSNNYDFIIIQQGPSSQKEGRKLLIESGKEITELIKNTNTRLVYFMVWPSLTYYQTFEGVIKNYTHAANVNNAILCPVGAIWKNHFDATNNFDYYNSDGFHPSLNGSKKAAEVIVNTLFK